MTSADSLIKMKIIEENMPAAWITWEKQTRNRSMAAIINVPLYELISNKVRLFRYIELSNKTIKLINKNKLKIVFAQNPSIILALLVTLLSKIMSFKVIIDAHNSGIFPQNGTSKKLMWLTKYIVRNSHITIVTNKTLANIVSEWGGTPFIMPDPVPSLPDVNQELSVSGKRPYVFCITSWSDDEPVREIIKAAKLIDDTINIVFSGNFKKVLSDIEVNNLPSNIFLAGFISEGEFVSYLRHAEAAIDLTTRDDCLVCGAYEAMSVGTPCIISNTTINREIFGRGFLYTENTSLAISKAISTVIENRQFFSKEIIFQLKAHNELTAEHAFCLAQKIRLLNTQL